MLHHFEVGVCFFFGIVEVIEGLASTTGESLKDCSVGMDVVGEVIAGFVVVSFDSAESCVEDGHRVGDDVDCLARLEETCHYFSPFRCDTSGWS